MDVTRSMQQPELRPVALHRHRFAWITTTVLLAHVFVLGCLEQSLPTSFHRSGQIDSWIMAVEVTDMATADGSTPRRVRPKDLPIPSAQKHIPAAPPSQPVSESGALPRSSASSVIAPMASPEPATVAASVSDRSPSSRAVTGYPSPSVIPSDEPAVLLPSSDADYLHNPPPAYPRMSRRMGEQGTAVVRVFINAEGRAESAELRTSSGFRRLDDAALETVKRWRYVPGKRAGIAESMWFNIPIRFVLD